ncbi:MAG: hypothetical protein LBS84_04240 [Clostridiales bacterium]|nr:hypothetical protein [Clostridiales bacterium]
MAEEKIQWHTAFYQGLRMELYDYLNILKFEAEYQLTAESLRMDVLVIKKLPGALIDKNIGRLFLGHNVIEYKSPEDSLSISGYHKVFAYAHLYATQENIDIRDITITYAVTRRPREVFKYLKSRGVNIRAASDGIYHISDETVPTQIVVSGELSKEDNLWLTALRHHTEAATVLRIFEHEKPDVDIAAYLAALLNANVDVLEEVFKMSSMPLEKKLEQMGFVNKAKVDKELARQLNEERIRLVRQLNEERIGMVRQREEERIGLAKAMLAEGTPSQTISKWLKMPIEDVTRLALEIKTLSDADAETL